jgi:HK97 family phage major capsid protein
MNRVLELRRKKAGLVERATAIRDAVAEGELMSAEQRTEFDGLMGQAEELVGEIEREERLALHGDPNQPANVAQRGMAAQHRRPTADTEEGIYCRYVRTGDMGALAELQQRASNDTTMNVTTPADGGYLVPTGHYNQIVERLRPQALHERLNVRRIPGAELTVNVPVDDEADSGEFVATNESTIFDRDAPAVNQKAMTLVMYTKKVDLTYQLLQGEDSGLMSFLARYVADGMAATLNKLLVTKALSAGTAGLTLDAPTEIGAAEVPELLYKLPARYAAGQDVAWLMRRATEGYLRGLRDDKHFAFNPVWDAARGQGNNGAWLWEGLPLYSDDNMGAMQASGKSMLIGNWAYMGMRLMPGLTLVRDELSRASYGEIILNYRFMAVFEVLQAQAFQYATHPTA